MDAVWDIVAGDQHAVHHAREIAIIANRIMQSGAIVPEGDRILAPAEADAVFGLFHFLVKLGEQGIALGTVEIDEAGLQAEVDPEDVLARFRMGADRGVRDQRIDLAGLGKCRLEIMDNVKIVDLRAESVRKAAQYRSAIGPDRVAAHIGDML